MKKEILGCQRRCLVLAAGILLVPPEAVEAGTLPAGITVGGVDLAGMTGEEADQRRLSNTWRTCQTRRLRDD